MSNICTFVVLQSTKFKWQIMNLNVVHSSYPGGAQTE